MSENGQLDTEEMLKDLEALVEELMKTHPKPEVVKSFMKKAGLPYKDDPFENISCVLQALNFQYSDMTFDRK